MKRFGLRILVGLIAFAIGVGVVALKFSKSNITDFVLEKKSIPIFTSEASNSGQVEIYFRGFFKNENFAEFKSSIVNSLKLGRSYITNFYYGDSKGFRFFAEYGGENFQMGDEIKLNGNDRNVVLNFLVPQEAQVKIMRNGSCIHEIHGFGGIWDVNEEGCYRIECWKGDRAWIFSNHIRIIK